MTPMQKLKSQFDEFKSLAMKAGFEELSLNKSEPKIHSTDFCGEITTHEDKGVRADFIKLFKIKFNKENAFSIGFDFEYLDHEEKDQKIVVSLKKGENEYWLSPKYSMIDFKEKMIMLVKTLKSQPVLNYQTLIETTENQFNLTLNVLPYRKKKKLG